MKKQWAISIIFIILGIQSNVIGGATSLDVQTIESKKIADTIKNNNNIDSNNNINLPGYTENDMNNYRNYLNSYIIKMSCNKFLSNKKYYSMIFLNNIFLFLEILEISNFLKFSNTLIRYKMNIYEIILSIIITIILLYDFNKYKKAKNSNDINQYKQYIIDDNNINQLTKQRRYNFINGLSMGICCINRLCFFIKTIKKYLIHDQVLVNIKAIVIHTIFNTTILIFFIIYVILKIIDNKNNLWNNIKNSFYVKDILFIIIYFLSVIITFFVVNYFKLYGYCLFLI